MSVDLTLLRETVDVRRQMFDLGSFDYLTQSNPIWHAAEAVLDAPKVWICGDLTAGGRDEGTFGDGTCSICGEYPDINGCGLRALVAVSGPS